MSEKELQKQINKLKEEDIGNKFQIDKLFKFASMSTDFMGQMAFAASEKDINKKIIEEYKIKYLEYEFLYDEKKASLKINLKEME